MLAHVKPQAERNKTAAGKAGNAPRETVTVYDQSPLRSLPPLIMLKGGGRLGIVMTVGDIAQELFEQMFRRMDEGEKHFLAWDTADKLQAVNRALGMAHLAGFGYIANRPAGFAYIIPMCRKSRSYVAHFWFGRGILREHALKLLRGFMGELPPCYLLAQIPGPYRTARSFIQTAGFRFICAIPEAAYLAHKDKAYDLYCYSWSNIINSHANSQAEVKAKTRVKVNKRVLRGKAA